VILNMMDLMAEEERMRAEKEAKKRGR